MMLRIFLVALLGTWPLLPTVWPEFPSPWPTLPSLEKPTVRAYVWTSEARCLACRKLQPAIDLLAYEGWDICTVDAEQYAKEAKEWGIDRIPTVQFMRGGKEVGRVVGPGSYLSLKGYLWAHQVNQRGG